MPKPANPTPPAAPTPRPAAAAQDAKPRAPAPAAPRAPQAPTAGRPARPDASGLSALASSSLSAAKPPSPPAARVASAAGATGNVKLAGSQISMRTVDLVQGSWAKVMPISDAAAAIFYDRLFERDPSVRALFKSDMGQQKKKLMQTLSVAVDGLNNVDKLVPILKSLGVRHAGYMVADHHYDLVGECLLWTLREGLGDDFTDDVEAAWTEVYTIIADVMKKAAAEHVGGSITAPDDGPISARTIALVQSSWAKVMPISDAAASLFYERLFETDPSTRPLFKNDLREQKKKLMQTLSVAVDGLNNLEKLVPVLQSLGARHAGYMVTEKHYDSVGAALLWTLREGLGDEFTDEVESAWTEVYTLVADVMKKAAAEHTGSPGLGRRASLSEAPTVIFPPPERPERSSSLPAPPPSTPPVQPSPRAVGPARRESGPPGINMVVPLSDKEITLNVRLTMEGSLPAAPPATVKISREGSTPATGASGGLLPALLLALICVVASMALAVLAPGLPGVSAQVLPRLGAASQLAVPVVVLVLILATFGLGYLWGRGRGSGGPGAGPTA